MRNNFPSLEMLALLLDFIKSTVEYKTISDPEYNGESAVLVETDGFYSACQLLGSCLNTNLEKTVDSSKNVHVKLFLQTVKDAEVLLQLFNKKSIHNAESFFGFDYGAVKKLIDFIKGCEEYNEETSNEFVTIKTTGLHLVLQRLSLIFPTIHDIFVEAGGVPSFSTEAIEFLVTEFETMEKIYNN